MPKVFASSLTRWASSALRSSALDGMQPTFRHTPPQYLDSTTATLLPSWAARMAATYPPGPAPRTTTSKEGMPKAYAGQATGAGWASWPALHGRCALAVRDPRRVRSVPVRHGARGGGVLVSALSNRRSRGLRPMLV